MEFKHVVLFLCFIFYSTTFSQEFLIKPDSSKFPLQKNIPAESGLFFLNPRINKFTAPLPFQLRSMLLNPSSVYLNKIHPWQTLTQEDIYSMIKANRNDLLKALQGSVKTESEELQFVRKFLGVSQDVAVIILMIVHLTKF